jgi:hypothetical protein
VPFDGLGIGLPDNSISRIAQRLFGYLFDRGVGSREALDLLANSKPCHFLEFYDELLDRDFGFTQLPSIVEKNLSVRDYSGLPFKLLKKMVDKGHGYAEALSIVKAQNWHFHSFDFKNDPRVLRSILELFIALLDKGYGYAEAEDCATIYLGSHNREVSLAALDLHRALLDRDHGYKAALRSVSSHANYGPSVDVARELFATLVSKENGYEMLLADIKKDNTDGYAQELFTAIECFRKRVNNGQSYVEGLAAAKEGMASDNRFVRLSGLNLFSALFDKKQAYSEAIEIANEGVKSFNPDVRESAARLFRMLFNRGRGYRVAAQFVRGPWWKLWKSWEQEALDRELRGVNRDLLSGSARAEFEQAMQLIG